MSRKQEVTWRQEPERSMWRELIARLDAQAVLHPPATAEQLHEAEAALGVALPAELRSLLLETNGAEVVYGLELVWSAQALAQRNLDLRSAWRRGEWAGTATFDHLLFFGERGNGDLYCLPIAGDRVENQVLLWDHEDDTRTSVATSLADWLGEDGPSA
jgi:cell wall assembly regulator SMI1